MTDRPDMIDGSGRLRRAPRRGDSQAPVTTIVMLVAGAIAVIIGFLILRSITGPGDESEDVVGGVTTTASTAPAGSIAPALTTTVPPMTSTTSTTTTVAPPASKSDATVVVANASGVDGSATALTNALAADGYTTAPVANATGPRLERSIIYYIEGNAASLGVARLLAQQIPSAQTLPMPEPPPLDRPLNQATVAVLLGRDAAGRPLSELRTG